MAEPRSSAPRSAPLAEAASEWAKAIPIGRDQLQSQILTGSVTAVLLIAGLRLELLLLRSHGGSLWPLTLSLVFAVTVWLLRSATGPAAGVGALICLLLATPAFAPSAQQPHPVLSPAILPLLALFVLTFAATRFKRKIKEASGLAESRQGRRASQIVANLGIAGLCAAIGFYPGVLAALAEATADTISSEIGQALGGPTWLLTSLRRIPPGTDGGISLRGSAAGVSAAALVVLAGSPGGVSLPTAAIVVFSSVAGLLFDSLLGATVERHGWIGNDLVNVSSTAFSVLLAWSLLRF